MQHYRHMQNFKSYRKQIFLCVILLAAFVSQTSAWEVTDKITQKQAEQIVSTFLATEEGKENSEEKQKLCCYVIEQACASKSDPEQDAVSNIFLEALKPSQPSTASSEISILNLPKELQQHIFSFVSSGDIRKAGEVSKSWRHMIEEGGWTTEEIAFCKEHYGKAPFELKEVPVLEVRVTHLAQYIPYARVIWGLRVVNDTPSHVFKFDDTFKLLKQFTQLIVLNVQKCNRSLPLECLPRNLIELYLSGDDPSGNMSDLPPKLITLYFRYCSNITDDKLKRLPKGLKTLGLIRCFSITNKGLTALPKALQILDLRGCSNVTDTGLISLKDTALTQLYLQGCLNIGDQELEALPKRIQILDLRGCSKVTDIGLKYLTDMPLTQLYLEGCPKITNKGLKALPKSLQTLDLRGCSKVTDTGLKYLTDMSLTQLYLKGCFKITNEGIKELPKQLTILDLRGCDELANRSTVYIKDMPLTQLYLGGCTKISDYGVQNLPEQLTILDLAHCNRITNNGLKVIEERCPNLTELNLYGCDQIDDNAIKELKARMPQLNVIKSNHLDVIEIPNLDAI